MALRTAAVPVSSARRFRLPRDATLGYLLLAPAAFLLLMLVGYPFLTAVIMSLQKKLIGQAAAPFIGLDNYITLVTDWTFWIVVRNVLVFAGSSVALKLVIGTAVALALNESMPGRGIVRSIMILPWALPSLVAVLIWMWMYSDVAGVFNHVLMGTGLVERPVLFLSDPVLAMISVIAVNVWKGFPFFSMTLLAGLQTVGSDQYDAAKVDGAGMVARFRHVTLPGLAPVMAVVTLLSTIFTLNDFAIIWLLTKGGPGNATDVLATLTYKVAIRGLELGKGVAISVLMLPLLIVLIVLLTRFLNKREEAG
ncbi:MAG: sugar ABC transporter permease [Chloroflexi bacterium]|nr:sugar ABC transporter permease [Chloroflexota bacterium]